MYEENLMHYTEKISSIFHSSHKQPPKVDTLGLSIYEKYDNGFLLPPIIPEGRKY